MKVHHLTYFSLSVMNGELCKPQKPSTFRIQARRCYATPLNFLIASVILGTTSNASPTIP